MDTWPISLQCSESERACNVEQRAVLIMRDNKQTLSVHCTLRGRITLKMDDTASKEQEQ